jgi:hypothetical protein
MLRVSGFQLYYKLCDDAVYCSRHPTRKYKGHYLDVSVELAVFSVEVAVSRSSC